MLLDTEGLFCFWMGQTTLIKLIKAIKPLAGDLQPAKLFFHVFSVSKGFKGGPLVVFKVLKGSQKHLCNPWALLFFRLLFGWWLYSRTLSFDHGVSQVVLRVFGQFL